MDSILQRDFHGCIIQIVSVQPLAEIFVPLKFSEELIKFMSAIIKWRWARIHILQEVEFFKRTTKASSCIHTQKCWSDCVRKNFAGKENGNVQFILCSLFRNFLLIRTDRRANVDICCQSAIVCGYLGHRDHRNKSTDGPALDCSL